MNPGETVGRMQGTLVDIGANLTHDSFDPDRDEVIRRAEDAGVGFFILTGASENGSRDALALARQHPGRMRATAGVHPHHAADYSARLEATLETLLEDPLTVAVGECGLDYFRNFSPVEAQRHAFQKQLELAVRVQKPVFLHQRDAHGDFVSMLSQYLERIPRAVAHCFTGDGDMLDTYLDMGLYIGITGWICDERRGRHLKDIVNRIPLDRLMIETDAPYLLPRSLEPKPKSRRNEPAFLPEVLRIVAESYAQPAPLIAEATTENAKRFFAL